MLRFTFSDRLLSTIPAKKQVTTIDWHFFNDTEDTPWITISEEIADYSETIKVMHDWLTQYTSSNRERLMPWTAWARDLWHLRNRLLRAILMHTLKCLREESVSSEKIG